MLTAFSRDKVWDSLSLHPSVLALSTHVSSKEKKEKEKKEKKMKKLKSGDKMAMNNTELDKNELEQPVVAMYYSIREDQQDSPQPVYSTTLLETLHETEVNYDNLHQYEHIAASTTTASPTLDEVKLPNKPSTEGANRKMVESRLVRSPSKNKPVAEIVSEDSLANAIFALVDVDSHLSSNHTPSVPSKAAAIEVANHDIYDENLILDYTNMIQNNGRELRPRANSYDIKSPPTATKSVHFVPASTPVLNENVVGNNSVPLKSILKYVSSAPTHTVPDDGPPRDYRDDRRRASANQVTPVIASAVESGTNGEKKTNKRKLATITPSTEEVVKHPGSDAAPADKATQFTNCNGDLSEQLRLQKPTPLQMNHGNYNVYHRDKKRRVTPTFICSLADKPKYLQLFAQLI